METLFVVLPLFCIVGMLVFMRFMRSLEDVCGLHSFGLEKQ